MKKPGNTRYRQLTRIRCDELRRRAGEEGRHFNELVEDEAHELAQILTRDQSDVYDAIGLQPRK